MSPIGGIHRRRQYSSYVRHGPVSGTVRTTDGSSDAGFRSRSPIRPVSSGVDPRASDESGSF
ncbi:hypothetical protein [Natrinema versiforme]|uniref:Uncharacterized protein n=1 Tax=Natrinema versiforme TaxID=88724 RepID=A0A4V1FZ23_9EURY|nr:hypothetical protein [Natrinema versiforme]QCS41524.1 hypothetical protein FEJ81_03825 [Natrinema versiforme]